MLKTGISGLRGTVADDGADLTALTIVRWVQAYVEDVKCERAMAAPRVALGRDARHSSPAIVDLARGALLMAGADVVDLGVTLTPTVQHYVRSARLDGGIMVTASHNPIIYNGLKFLDHDGFFLPLEAWGRMRHMVSADQPPTVALDRLGSVAHRGDAAWEAHLNAAIRAVDLDAIRALRLRVALDACNGGAARWVEFLDACGCEVLLLHSEQHGFFDREAEPLPQHLSALQNLVRQANCDIGFAADPDGDRLVLVDARGDTVSEEMTVVLAAKSLFGGGRKGTIVVNAVTTHAIEEVVDATVVRTAVGEMNVVNGIMAHDALMGGEGSGGIIIPRINLARDGLAAMAMILRLMAREQRQLHEIILELPCWESIKSKVTATTNVDALRSLFNLWIEHSPKVTLNEALLELVSEAGSLHLARTPESLQLRAETRSGATFAAEGNAAGLAPLFRILAASQTTLDLTDGVKIIAKDGWLSLRPSNTEPIVRIMGEIRQ